jgi:hypothetical protein
MHLHISTSINQHICLKAIIKIFPHTEQQSKNNAKTDYVADWFDNPEGYLVTVFGVARHSKKMKNKDIYVLH